MGSMINFLVQFHTKETIDNQTEITISLLLKTYKRKDTQGAVINQHRVIYGTELEFRWLYIYIWSRHVRCTWMAYIYCSQDTQCTLQYSKCLMKSCIIIPYSIISSCVVIWPFVVSFLQVSTGKGIASYLVHLFVAVPEAFILGNGEYHIQEGSVINLVCIVEKVPFIIKVILYHLQTCSLHKTFTHRAPNLQTTSFGITTTGWSTTTKDVISESWRTQGVKLTQDWPLKTLKFPTLETTLVTSQMPILPLLLCTFHKVRSQVMSNLWIISLTIVSSLFREMKCAQLPFCTRFF